LSASRRWTPAARREASVGRAHTAGIALVAALVGLFGYERGAGAVIPALEEYNEPLDPSDLVDGPVARGAAASRGQQPEFEVNIDLMSAYVFRGYNVFQSQSQGEQKWVQRPRVIYTVPQTGLSLGYAAANQISGDNLVSNVSAGLGAEQDIFASYAFARRERFGVEAELAVVGYPAADSRVVGTSAPYFFSFSVEPRYRHLAFLYLGYLAGFRKGPLEGSQGYINPRFEKRFDFGDSVELELQFGAGMKILQTDLSVVRDNMFDVLGTATLYYALTDVFYVGVKVGWAWTNFTPSKDPDTGQTVTPRFADEYVPFWGVTMGAEFTARGSTSVPRHRAHTM
jgi:hypothetical protein